MYAHDGCQKKDSDKVRGTSNIANNIINNTDKNILNVG